MSWHKRFTRLTKRNSSSGSSSDDTSSNKSTSSLNNISNSIGNINISTSNTNTNTNTSTSNTAMDHSHSEQQLWGAVEILPQRLYYAPLKFFPPEVQSEGDSDEEQGRGNNRSTGNRSNKPIHYFSIDNELLYWNFFLDFGPLNLGQLHRFCSKLNAKLIAPEYKDCIICYYSGAKGEARANAIFMICAWSMLYLGRTLEESYFGFREEFEFDTNIGVGEGNLGLSNMEGNNSSSPPQLRRGLGRSSSNISSSSSRSSDSKLAYASHRQPSPFARIHPLPPFHDASPIVCTYDLSVYDCLQGLDKARQFGFFKFGNTPPLSSSAADNASTSTSTSSSPVRKPRKPSTFNVSEYEYFEQVENGDLNWIVQNKILAFAGPQAQKVITPEGFCMLTPADYIPYFVKTNVKLVVRLNKRCYDKRDFERAGISHVEHYYLDGSCPPMNILHAVISDMETLDVDDNSAMAVHCKAGLGRTGTCIGAYLMKHYKLTANEVIGWMRICRPGMVIGPQQHFLADVEGLMWQEGEAMRAMNRVHVVSGLGGVAGRVLRTTTRRNSGRAEEDIRDDDKKLAAATTTAVAVSPSSVLSTPQKDTPRQSRTPSSATKGAHVSIVTPDGQPLHIPTTPINVARKLDLKPSHEEEEEEDADMMMLISSSMSAESPMASPSIESISQQQQIDSTASSTPSLSTIDSLKVDQGTGGATVMHEGDQANALLSRRLDQYQARQGNNSK